MMVVVGVVVGSVTLSLILIAGAVLSMASRPRPETRPHDAAWWLEQAAACRRDARMRVTRYERERLMRLAAAYEKTALDLSPPGDGTPLGGETP